MLIVLLPLTTDQALIPLLLANNVVQTWPLTQLRLLPTHVIICNNLPLWQAAENCIISY